MTASMLRGGLGQAGLAGRLETGIARPFCIQVSVDRPSEAKPQAER